MMTKLVIISIFSHLWVAHADHLTHQPLAAHRRYSSQWRSSDKSDLKTGVKPTSSNKPAFVHNDWRPIVVVRSYLHNGGQLKTASIIANSSTVKDTNKRSVEHLAEMKNNQIVLEDDSIWMHYSSQNKKSVSKSDEKNRQLTMPSKNMEFRSKPKVDENATVFGSHPSHLPIKKNNHDQLVLGFRNTAGSIDRQDPPLKENEPQYGVFDVPAKPLHQLEMRSMSEYHTQLFNSFGSHEDNNAHQHHHISAISSLSNTSKRNLQNYKYDATTEHGLKSSQSFVSMKNQSIHVNCSNETDENCKSENKSLDKKNHNEDGLWNWWLNLTGIRLTDLIPDTLKTNLFLMKRSLVDCYPNNNLGGTFSCVKRIILKIIDNAIRSDHVKITDAVSMVIENRTSVEQIVGRFANTERTDWFPNLIEKIQTLFSTHSLKVQLMKPEENGNLLVEGRRRHYRRVFPIMVGAYMILSAVLIPLGFKFMIVLGALSLLISKLSLLIASMGGIKKYMGMGNDYPAPQTPHYPPYYPSPYPSYPPYYDPWRKEEFRKMSHHLDYPTDYSSHFTEEVE